MNDFIKCHIEFCDHWFEYDDKLDSNDPNNQYCFFHGGKITSMMPEKQSIPYRRCIHLNERGEQCETYFPAETDDKLCEEHRLIATPSARNGETTEQKIRYIDLVNDERKYCYHFKDGSKQNQEQKLIFEFKDDQDGTIFDKLDNHIAFLEKVLEDVKARLHSSRAVKTEKLENLSEEQRKELRKIKVERLTKTPSEKRISSTVIKAKDDWKNILAGIGASFDMNPDDIIAKFKAKKANESETKGEK